MTGAKIIFNSRKPCQGQVMEIVSVKTAIFIFPAKNKGKSHKKNNSQKHFVPPLKWEKPSFQPMNMRKAFKCG